MLYYYDTRKHDELFNYVIKNQRYIEIFLMYMEKSYNNNRTIMAMLSAIENLCFNSGRFNPYFFNIVREILKADISVDKKLHAALRECMVRLERLSISNIEER
jgi:hypothetical protein